MNTDSATDRAERDIHRMLKALEKQTGMKLAGVDVDMQRAAPVAISLARIEPNTGTES